MIKYPFNCVEKLNIKIFCTLLCWDLSFYWRSSLISTMRYIQRSGDNCQQLVLKLELEMELEPGVICYSCLQSPAPSLNGSCHSGNEDLMITHHHHYTTYLMGKQNIANIAKIQITKFLSSTHFHSEDVLCWNVPLCNVSTTNWAISYLCLRFRILKIKW